MTKSPTRGTASARNHCSDRGDTRPELDADPEYIPRTEFGRLASRPGETILLREAVP